ncbi:MULTISPECIES: peptide chain release factor 3 [unclassified Modestobacter]|uniref:peptide chain release factor 3 n=1 Tax=unclassified Modestobacter TaxID=2643866 RepID=UPI0022AB18E6|nr:MULTISPECIES: peptide chain release factor 3 [unclassified Modestobacter]MCZ2823168.1 peptide chain release factor 3 [Modestobacter sp. VKM Ac-2981]MCZ2851414.1 peptide chain release factor 3 [Modestobacter sp. VKM Ac-2982]
MSTVPSTELRPDAATGEVLAQASRRRTFAVISHPDAGKSTLTEALALHARVIGQAGAVHGKAGRRGTVSDWMDMEKARGISITSAALQFEYRDAVVNLLDTPGHADFSEDTYRVLTAVDAAVMLIDAAKGLEAQTMKLFAVCRHRGIPVITVVNKWDRPGKDALELMDEVAQRTGLEPTPLTWPVGISGDFRGVLDRRDGTYRRFTRTAGGATIAPEETLTAAAAEAREGIDWTRAVEENELLDATEADHDQERFLAGETTPVIFASAVSNFGVGALLDVLVDLAPPPPARPDADGVPRPIEASFSAFVFKVQSGMDAAHRDRLAYIRIASGVFERGMVVTHATTGRPFATKYAQHVFGRERESVDTAYPGDVVGLVNANALHVGDTLYAGTKVTFPPLTTFAPEHFAVMRGKDTAKFKQFRRGVGQLGSEGVAQVLRSDRRGDQAPVLAVVGPMQFEVAAHRMAQEFGAPVELDHLPYQVAVRTDAASAPAVAAARGVEVFEREDGELLALFMDKWDLRSLQQRSPELTLEPMVAAQLS